MYKAPNRIGLVFSKKNSREGLLQERTGTFRKHSAICMYKAPSRIGLVFSRLFQEKGFYESWPLLKNTRSAVWQCMCTSGLVLGLAQYNWSSAFRKSFFPLVEAPFVLRKPKHYWNSMGLIFLWCGVFCFFLW